MKSSIKIFLIIHFLICLMWMSCTDKNDLQISPNETQIELRSSPYSFEKIPTFENSQVKILTYRIGNIESGETFESSYNIKDLITELRRNNSINYQWNVIYDVSQIEMSIYETTQVISNDYRLIEETYSAMLLEAVNADPCTYQHTAGPGAVAGLEYLRAKLDEDPYFFYGGEDCIKDRPQFQTWFDLVSFLPDSDFDELLPEDTSLAPFGTNLPAATINLDYFYVELCDLPDDFLPAALYEILRSVFYDVLDAGCNSNFELYPGYTFEDWVDNPVGTPFQIDIPGNDGDVIATYQYNLDDNSEIPYDGYHWIFTTIQGGKSGDHPVSGNRKFGMFKSSDNCWTFYTLGTDRLYPSVLGVGIQGDISEAIGFPAADALWNCLIKNVGEYAEAFGITVGNMGSETCRPNISSFFEAWKRSCYEPGLLDDEFKECLECG